MKYGASYFGNRMLRHFIQRDLPEVIETGCSFILHTFSEYDWDFYRDAVGAMVRASKEAGLEVYLDPWGVAGAFGGEAYSRFLLRHPDAWHVRSDGVPLPIACPSSLALRDFMEEWLDAAARLGPDVIFWDEPSFTPKEAASDVTVCHCSRCRRRFYERFGSDLPDHRTPELTAFQEDCAIDFIGTLSAFAARRGLRNAVCLLPFEDDAHGLPHWERIASLPHVDVLGVTPFWHLRGYSVEEYVPYWAAKVKDLCDRHGKEPQVWVQGFLIDAGREHEAGAAVAEAAGAGVRNIAVWGFRACEHMTALRPDNPEAVWQAVTEAFARNRPTQDH